MGPLADVVSPLPSYLPNGVWAFTRRQHASRVLFLTATCCVLLLTYTWTFIGVRSQEALWTLRYLRSCIPRKVLVSPQSQHRIRICVWCHLHALVSCVSSSAHTVCSGAVHNRPSILSSIWGIVNLARNFGVFSYAVFVGTPLFSYLYAIVAAHNAEPGKICQGTQCWKLTFGLSIAAVSLSTSLSLVLWRRWRDRV